MPDKKLLGIVFSYYETPGLLQKQLNEWCLYMELWKDISVYIIDDCSKRFPLLNINSMVEPSQTEDIHKLKISEKKSWNWSVARNIGAKEANTEWLLLTDIDHIIDKRNLRQLLKELPNFDKQYVYYLNRKDGQTGKSKTPHGASFVMTRDLYWKIGGFNERFMALYHNFLTIYKKKVKMKCLGFKLIDNVYLTWIDHNTVGDNRYINGCSTKKPVKNGKEIVLSLPYVEL